MKKQLAKLIAMLMTVAMLLGAVACSATENNPVIGKIGRVKITFDQYQAIYQQNFYSYLMGGSSSIDLNEYIKEQLITYGVTLNRCYEEGIELTDEEIAEKVQEQIDSRVESYELDEDISDEDEKYAAQYKKFEEELAKNNLTLDKYKENIIEAYREDWLMEKLREKVYAEVTMDDAEVKKYFDEHIEDARKEYGDDAKDYASNFYTDYSSYVQGNGMIPLYTPKDMFTVKHMLVRFEENADDPKDGKFSEDGQKLVDETLELIKDGNDTTFEEFEEFVKEKSDDPGMQQDGYIEHGYLMNEQLIDKYYDGFGYASMKLYAGRDWEPAAEEEEDDKATGTPDASATPTAEPTPTATPAASATPTPEPKTYDVEYYTLSDGTEIAAVKTSVGIHYIYIKEKLEAGDVPFEDDPENDIWQNIHEFRLLELQQQHYSDRYAEWKAETKIRMKDDYIDQIAARLYGI